MFINKVTLYGNLTKDSELKALPNGTNVTTFSVATNRSIKDSTGAKKDIPEYHNVVAFGKQAELINVYLRKGNPIYIEGRIQTRSWDGQDGKKNYRTEIIVENFQFGPKSSGVSKPTSSDEPQSTDIGEVKYPEEDINPEDIPF